MGSQLCSDRRESESQRRVAIAMEPPLEIAGEEIRDDPLTLKALEVRRGRRQSESPWSDSLVGSRGVPPRQLLSEPHSSLHEIEGLENIDGRRREPPSDPVERTLEEPMNLPRPLIGQSVENPTPAFVTPCSKQLAESPYPVLPRDGNHTRVESREQECVTPDFP